MNTTQPSSNFFKFCQSLFLGYGLSLIIYQIPKPKFIENYNPIKREAFDNGLVNYHWTKFITHGRIEDQGDGYATELTDLDTHKKYLVDSYPVGEYWNITLKKGHIISATKPRIKISCKESKQFIELPPIYDDSDCIKYRTIVPDRPYSNPDF